MIGDRYRILFVVTAEQVGPGDPSWDDVATVVALHIAGANVDVNGVNVLIDEATIDQADDEDLL